MSLDNTEYVEEAVFFHHLQYKVHYLLSKVWNNRWNGQKDLLIKEKMKLSSDKLLTNIFLGTGQQYNTEIKFYTCSGDITHMQGLPNDSWENTQMV